MKLVTPTADLHASWLAANAEWGGEHQDGAATHLARGLDLTDPVDFATWVEMLNDDSVAATNHWMVEDGEYLGAVQLRHTIDSPALADLFGHALREVLTDAREIGLHRVLVCCREDNAASISVIRACGGVLENIRHVDEFSLSHGVSTPTCRFWIETAS